MATDQRSSVKSADRVLDIFELLASRGPGLSHQEISEILGVPKSSLSELLRNLIARGYVDFAQQTRSYGLGNALYTLVRQSTELHGLIERAEPILRGITAATRESCALSMRKDDELEIIAAIDSPLRFLYHMRLGDRAPLYATSGGKCILAFLRPEALDTYLAKIELEPCTSMTVSSVERLREELETVRQRQIAYAREEFTLGIASLGVPILREDGEVVASLNIAMPTLRLDREAEDRAIAALRNARSLLESGLQVSP